MKKKPVAAEEKGVTTRSSISVSDQIVCEDEACIGKAVTPPAMPPEDTAQPDESKKNSPGTAMSFGGKEGCIDETCIGKK